MEYRIDVYLEKYREALPDYMYEIEADAKKNIVPILGKSMRDILRFYIKCMKPKNVLEIGTAVGFSTLMMREYIPEDGKIFTIEMNEKRIKAAKENFEKYDVNGNITLMEGDASDKIKELAEKKMKFQLIFMDAAKGQYPTFLPYLVDMLDDAGVLMTDNVFHHGNVFESKFAVSHRDRTIHERLREFMTMITDDPRLETVCLPVGDGITMSQKVMS